MPPTERLVFYSTSLQFQSLPQFTNRNGQKQLTFDEFGASDRVASVDYAKFSAAAAVAAASGSS